MKIWFYYLTVIIALGVNSCSSFKDKPFEERTQAKDYLIYQVSEHPKPSQLFFYDPTSHLPTQILTDWDISIYEFSVGTNNRLAFSTSRNGSDGIYVLDFPFTENVPTRITHDTSTIYRPLSWSADGHYLLLNSIQNDNKKLSLWDGKNFLDIYDYHGEIFEVTWSEKGQLAFTEFFINNPSGDRSEVYIWDSVTTLNASQNPSGEDRFPAWSEDGQLAFLSNRNGEHDILVWDGVLKQNDTPDINSFTNIAPDLTQYFSSPTWTNKNSIAFSGGSESDAQIYEWDGQSVKNISQNKSFHNGGETWRSDGFWSFTTFFSSSQNIYVRDNLNQTVLETKGQYSPAWSPNGLLAFCVPEYPDWTLSIWNGKNVIEIAHGRVIVAKWNSEEYVSCSD